MKVAIVDDQKEFIDMMEKKLEKVRINNLEVYSYLSVLDMDKTKIQFDLILLDIDMGEVDGIEYSKMNREKNVVFVTSQEKRMEDAFGSNVYGFIKKSYSDKEFINKVGSIINEITVQRCITLKIAKNYISFVINKIIYLQYIGYKTVCFVYNKQSYTVRGYSLYDLQNLLGKQFVYINRETMVNVEYIFELVEDALYLKGIKSHFSISERRKKQIRTILNNRL